MKTIYVGSLRMAMAFCLIAQPWATVAQAVDLSAPEAAQLGNADASATAGFTSAGDTTRATSVGTLNLNLPRTPITMDFQDADVRDVLHLLAIKSGINIIYGADVTGPISVHLDHVPFDQAFQTILTLRTLVALPMGPKIIRVITSTTLTTEQSQAATFTRVFKLNYADAADVKKPVDAIRSSAARKGVSTVDTKTNSLIITDTVEGLKEVEELIPVLDKKPQQVDIESKIVEVSLSNNTQSGISWAYAGNQGAYQIGGVNNTQQANFPGNQSNLPVTGSVITPIVPGAASNATSTGGSPIGTGVNLAGPSSVGFSFLTQQGTYLLSAQISALATEGRVKILSTPHIVTTNNEEAHISVADNIPYTVTTVSNGVSQSAVQFISAGVKLSVKPTVNADRRITLHVKPEVSNAVGTGSQFLPPTVNTRDAETTIVLRDGETIAIGGLIQENVNKSTSGIPFLMSIPIIGYLFKTVTDIKTRDELIVFLTPKIAAE
jgi:type IV pilus assembly protein PilQ